MTWAEFQKVLPATASVNDRGRLQVGGCDVVELAAEFGTPLFVCDLVDVRGRLGRYRDVFGGDNVFYASKAFLTKSFAPIVAETGVGMDCVAGGELHVALAGGFPGGRITVHGNNPSRSELVDAVRAGVGRIVVDSFDEIDMLDGVARELGVRAPVLVRVTPGVEVHTHSYLMTGVEDSKFGFTIGEVAADAVAMAAAASGLELTGVHSHIGSQAFETEPFAEAARKMTRLLADARRETGLPLPHLDLGGGLGIAYTPGDAPVPIEDLAKVLDDAVAEEAERCDTPVPVISVEPGRSAVGPSMVTLYTSGVVKDVPGLRRYVSVDGGMSDNIRVPLYQARYTFLSAARPEAPHDVACTIAGKLCETGDLLGDTALPELEPGEILACAATGAYGYAMSSNYNKQPRAAVVAVADGDATVLARRETYEDLTRLE
jgi:diaminopimelate decarboxylase